MKWTFEQKMAWVKAYKNGEWVPVPAGCPSSPTDWHIRICRWAHVLEAYGEDGLRHLGTRAFSKEDKLRAVARVESGESASAVAYSLGMADCSRVLAWLRAYRESGPEGLESRRKGRKPKGAQEEGGDAGAAADRGAGAGEPPAGARELLLKKIEGLGGVGGATPRQKYEAILETRKERPEAALSELLSAAEMAKSSYFYESKRPDFDEKNKGIAERIASAFGASDGRYGVRRVCAAVNEGRERKVNHKKVQRLMAKMGLSARRKAVHYNSYKGKVGEVAPDLIIVPYVRKDGQTHHRSDFSTTGPNQKWTTDVSQFSGPFGKAYLSPIKDMGDGRIVSYDLSQSPNTEQIRRMLDGAFAANPHLEGLILHSDQGWQYQQPWYVKELKDHGIRQSMSRKGNCLDNCIMESFFGTMKNEMFCGHESEFRTFGELKAAVDKYIKWYNEVRIRRYKDGKWMSPSARYEASRGGHP